MQEKDAQRLIAKYKAGRCTEEELVLLRNWFNQLNQSEDAGLSQDELTQTGEEIWRMIRPQTQKVKRLVLWPRIAAAASIILALSFGGYFVFHKHAPQLTAGNYKNDVKPGNNGAILTLAGGQKVILEQTKAGKIAQQNGTNLSKAGDSLLIYKAGEASANYTMSYNTLETPRGKQYSVILPDGSKVWLNAASSLRYPTIFKGKERLVTLSGEAYFEVIHNAKMPFRVSTNGQIVEDIGTHFNITAYPDEAAVKTTLLEGSVRVSSLNHAAEQLVLSPGEQSTLEQDELKKKEVDTELAIAWKNGLFYYKNAPLTTVMRQIARWYDVEIDYEVVHPQNQTFSGSVSRYDQVSKILTAIELTGAVKFKIAGRKITVIP